MNSVRVPGSISRIQDTHRYRCQTERRNRLSQSQSLICHDLSTKIQMRIYVGAIAVAHGVKMHFESCHDQFRRLLRRKGGEAQPLVLTENLWYCQCHDAMAWSSAYSSRELSIARHSITTGRPERKIDPAGNDATRGSRGSRQSIELDVS